MAASDFIHAHVGQTEIGRDGGPKVVIGQPARHRLSPTAIVILAGLGVGGWLLYRHFKKG